MVIYTCMYICTHTHAREQPFTETECRRMCLFQHNYIYLFICLYIYIHTYIHTCIHIHIYMCIHKYTRIYENKNQYFIIYSSASMWFDVNQSIREIFVYAHRFLVSGACKPWLYGNSNSYPRRGVDRTIWDTYISWYIHHQTHIYVYMKFVTIYDISLNAGG